MKTFAIWAGVIVALLAGSYLYKTFLSNDPDIVAQNGIHWHPELKIYVKGEEQQIPQGIGLGAVHAPIHTHEDLPIIHLELQGLVKKSDVTLGKFLQTWGKDSNSLGTNLKMTVNGKENTEYENYVMQDKDKIELRYE